MVLERGDAGDQRRRFRRQGLPAELERVAEPLAGDPQLVERLDVGPAQDRLVGPDALVRGQDVRAGGVADAVRLRRPDRRDREALVAHELAVVVDPSPILVGVELADQQPAGVLPVEPPAGEQRLERRAAPSATGRPGRHPPPRAARRGRGPRPAARRSRGGRGGRSSCDPRGTRRRTRARPPAGAASRPAWRGGPRDRCRRGFPAPWRASAPGGSGGPSGRPRRRGRRA